MAERASKRASRRLQVRARRAETFGAWRSHLLRQTASWPVLAGILFIVGASLIALASEGTLGYSAGQRIDREIRARVDFQVPNEEQTQAAREAARAMVPSYYTVRSATFERIRADLMRLYRAAIDAETFEAFQETLEPLTWPAERRAYEFLRTLADEAGRTAFQKAVHRLPLEREYVVRDLIREPRNPKSATDFIRIALSEPEGDVTSIDVPIAELVPDSEPALRRSAASVARVFPYPAVSSTVEAIVFAAFRANPTIGYNAERTIEGMRKAEEATQVVYTKYEQGKVFIKPGVLSAADYELLLAERSAYHRFLEQDAEEAVRERRARRLQQTGLVTLMSLLSIGLMAYTGLHHRRVFEVGWRTIAFLALILATLAAARVLDLKWPQLVYLPGLVAASILAIAYPRRFAIGVMCIVAVMIATVLDASLVVLLTLLTGVVVTIHQLDEIRTRTKLITTGVMTGLAMIIAAGAGTLSVQQPLMFVLQHSLWAGANALLASFVVSGTLPLIERMFRIATSLTLLEWRDPTRPLLQLLAREAPGTYNHSLVLGTLAEAACERIGANALLTQVGALYHDIGKIHKAGYFTENQEGQISRHDNLAPTMSLLIILGHVKDGIEMAKEYKLPRVLHQFIAEHHGTTVVRYFHHVASEKQPQIASGRHDREVSEAEFRYPGPRPRTKESAVLMLCDGVEGAVRALQDPTPSRIESVVHRILMDRLTDGQFDDCDITMRELRLVEESLVKSLCSIYHGRVAYPKARSPQAFAPERRQRISG